LYYTMESKTLYIIFALIVIIIVIVVLVYQSLKTNGGWTTWSNPPCSAPCNTGIIERERSCTNPVPAYGGAPCIGPTVENVLCNTENCPINGGWGNWTSTTECSKSCNTGTLKETRLCKNPVPEFGGKMCVGESTEYISCNTENCPINGGWTSWVNQEGVSCSKTGSCSGLTIKQTRTCTNPAPMFGGTNCSGISSEIVSCNVNSSCTPTAWKVVQTGGTSTNTIVPLRIGANGSIECQSTDGKNCLWGKTTVTPPSNLNVLSCGLNKSVWCDPTLYNNTT
jgi:hypothetical protein